MVARFLLRYSREEAKASPIWSPPDALRPMLERARLDYSGAYLALALIFEHTEA